MKNKAMVKHVWWSIQISKELTKELFEGIVICEITSDWIDILERADFHK